MTDRLDKQFSSLSTPLHLHLLSTFHLDPCCSEVESRFIGSSPSHHLVPNHQVPWFSSSSQALLSGQEHQNPKTTGPRHTTRHPPHHHTDTESDSVTVTRLPAIPISLSGTEPDSQEIIVSSHRSHLRATFVLLQPEPATHLPPYIDLHRFPTNTLQRP